MMNVDELNDCMIDSNEWSWIYASYKMYGSEMKVRCLSVEYWSMGVDDEL